MNLDYHLKNRPSKDLPGYCNTNLVRMIDGEETALSRNVYFLIANINLAAIFLVGAASGLI